MSLFGERSRCESELYLTFQDETGNENWLAIRCSNQTGMCEEITGCHVGRSSVLGMQRWSDQDALDSFRAYRNITVQKSDKALKGWRCWRILSEDITEDNCYNNKTETRRETNYYLMSTAVWYRWNGPVATIRHGNKVSSEFRYGDTNAGVFAYKSLKRLNIAFQIKQKQFVFGRVDLTGHVIEHELGYRAQKCTIRELWVLYNLHKMRAREIKSQFEQRYQCDVHTISHHQIPHMIGYISQEEKESKHHE